MDTQTREIPRSEWNSFFNAFSREHEGWLASLQVVGAEVGAQEEAHELPLEGISISDDRESAIDISLGGTPDDHITHSITEPKHVWVERTSSGADESIEIEGSETKTLLRFRSPVRRS